MSENALVTDPLVTLRDAVRVFAAQRDWDQFHSGKNLAMALCIEAGELLHRRPWDAKPGKWRLAAGIPSASLWATDPNGINPIGCVYNIQGFELDYVGVIWGRDLRYDLDRQMWMGNKKESADSVVKRSKEKFVDLVKNTYRVLLSRGIKGCYVHFMDRDTERFIRSRMEVAANAAGPAIDGRYSVAEDL